MFSKSDMILSFSALVVCFCVSFVWREFLVLSRFFASRDWSGLVEVSFSGVFARRAAETSLLIISFLAPATVLL